MLRVLTLSTLFPDASRPTFGPFVERQTLELAARPDVSLQVVAPVGLPPAPLNRTGTYRALTALPVREDWKGVTVHRPRFVHLPGTAGRFDAQAMVRALLPVLREIGHSFAFDVIDTEFFFPDGPAAVKLGATLGVPVSIKARGSDIHYWSKAAATRDQILEAAKAADGLLAVSEALKRDMVALGIDESRVRVHYTGVDLDRFRPRDRAETKKALDVTGTLVVSVGGLIERKGQGLVIDALAKLPGATLALIGDGPMRGKYESRAAKLGVAERVRFLGIQPQDEIAKWLAAADVMALPSASEGLANAWVEALACGTPVVIADAGGARELVKDEAAGRIVERTADAVTDAIGALLVVPPDAALVRKSAEPFTWEANTAALFDHLSGLKR